MPAASNILATTADRFNKALAIAYRQHPPPCLTEVRGQKSEVRSTQDSLLITHYSLLPCRACPLALSPDTCPHRYQLKKAIVEAIALD